MTVEEFQARKAELLITYGSTAQDAGRKRAQALARLYAESGFTQRALAELEHIAQSHVHHLLVFGRFLTFLITIGNQEYPYPERVFRKAWVGTDTNRVESARFQAIAEQMQAPADTAETTSRTTRELAKALIAQCADSKWHTITAMAEAVESDIPTVRPILDRIVAHGSFQTFAEKRPSAKGLFSYRLVKGGTKKINVQAFQEEVEPLLEEMWTHITGHDVHFSKGTIKVQIDQLRKLIARMGQ